jgi:prefoldin subunit 5
MENKEQLLKKIEELEKLLDWKNKRISELEQYSRELESKVYGGTTK